MKDTNLLEMLREIEAVYRADGIGKARIRMANDMGVPQPYISKWLGTKNIRPQTPDAKYAVKIYALYERATGRKAIVPITTMDGDPHIQKVIAIMESMDEAHRESFAKMAEVFPRG